MTQVLVLGGGFGGLAAAHELRARLPADDEVVVVASRDRFFVGFAKLWDLVEARPLGEGSAELHGLERHGIRFVHADVTGIDGGARAVETTAGDFAPDGLVVALGAGYHPAHRQLLSGSASAHNLYDAAALPAMRADLARLGSGRVVVSVLGGPYLCPPAPFEAALLVEERLREQGRRDDVDVTVTTPMPLTLPVAGTDASAFLAERLGERGVEVRTGHKVTAISDGEVAFEGGEGLGFEILLGVPAASPPGVVAASDLAGEGGWIAPDPRTFATAAERVYAVGDCTQVPTPKAQLPKAGVFAEAGGRVAARNLAAELGHGEGAAFDGHGYCFLEIGGELVARVEGDFYADDPAAIALSEPDRASFEAKQRWERERLAAWL